MDLPVVAVVGLGGNVGDSGQTLRRAFQALEDLPDSTVLATSPLYRTPDWGVEDQADFINAAAAISTALAPQALLDALFGIERDFGRIRAADGSDRWGPRTLDLDLLLYGDEQIASATLTVPHPRITERAFVLVPLLALAPAITVPGKGAASDYLAGVADQAISQL